MLNKKTLEDRKQRCMIRIDDPLFGNWLNDLLVTVICMIYIDSK